MCSEVDFLATEDAERELRARNRDPNERWAEMFQKVTDAGCKWKLEAESKEIAAAILYSFVFRDPFVRCKAPCEVKPQSGDVRNRRYHYLYSFSDRSIGTLTPEILQWHSITIRGLGKVKFPTHNDFWLFRWTTWTGRDMLRYSETGDGKK